jgi:FkbM family methyltransferase
MVAVDLGANVGRYTEVMASSGATVHAFEPNPYAYAALQTRVGSAANVVLHAEAASNREGSARLFLHLRATEGQVRWSGGSSLFEEKGNVDPKNFVDVRQIDFAAFVAALETPIELVKMNIEGAEIPILEHLLETGTLGRINRLLIECHPLPSAERAAEVCRRVAATHPSATFDWG